MVLYGIESAMIKGIKIVIAGIAVQWVDALFFHGATQIVICLTCCCKCCGLFISFRTLNDLTYQQ